ncbi:hypothetical protein ScPMuIL_004095 [Solemya velum]
MWSRYCQTTCAVVCKDLNLITGELHFLRKSSHCTQIATHGHGNHCNQASLYIHWPYCQKRCSYCNFNKYISRNVDNDRMTRCLVTELKNLLGISGVSSITSVFFGGGTPSLADPQTIFEVLEVVKETSSLADRAEISIEVNPTHLETKKLVDFQHAGINRVSVGVQSLKAGDLSVLGRDHTVEEAVRCVLESRKLFPGRVSVDMIFGRPNQTIDQWTEELQELLKICDSHVSLYQLTLERGTKLFKQVHQGTLMIPDGDVMAEMYRASVEILERSGLCRYEVSNFSTKDAQSLHNRSYWEGRQYLGVGPGAHGRFVPVGLGKDMREARIQTLEPDNWMFEVEKFGHATRRAVPLTKLEQLQEVISLGLRMQDGLTSSRWLEHQGGTGTLNDIFGSCPSVNNLISNNFLTLDARGMRATSEGLIVLDSILPYLLNTLTDFTDCTGR